MNNEYAAREGWTHQKHQGLVGEVVGCAWYQTGDRLELAHE